MVLKELKDEYNLVNIKDLKFKYNKKSKNYDLIIPELRIKEGQIVSLLGPSGSGKTTLLNILLGYLKPESGKITIKNSPKIHEIAYIMQENSIYENVSVFNNIFLSARNNRKWIDSSRIRYFDSFFEEYINFNLLEKYMQYASVLYCENNNFLKKKWRYFKFWWQIFFAKNLPSKFKILKDLKLKNLFKTELQEVAKKLGIDHLIHKNVNELSGGQKQRVAFAKGIIKKTNLVLMDEPFSALDAKIKESTIDWLLKIKKEFNLSIIIVTHDQEDAMKISDQIILLDKGQVQQFSTGGEMYENPNNLFVAKFIGSPEINFIEKNDKKSFYIRQNKVQVKQVNNGKYKVVGKKDFGDRVHYQIEINPENIWTVILKDESIAVGKRVNIKYLKSDVLVFDKNGERLYE
ncbi:glycerol ABC transporter ATP-binding protein [Mycoplasmopsis californica]|uniref:Glycerol ABC transporter ATP-binding protein n=1 Tax=Mycoplasmopsis californica TaxID=2113 RepID=A0A059XQC5_9BACT|nr:ABC transporter ATP-binding protein [Mycoplasmopsis californica]AIA29225.1 glycerol ABC transporter ATP-binding protein [Mycoplasmopsis californica]